METPITIIERHFNIVLSEETYQYFTRLPLTRWYEFADEYRHYAKAFNALNKGKLKQSESELAPYLFEYLSYSKELGAPLGDVAEVVRIEETITALKRLLLYHHRVFIPDWFLWLLDYMRWRSEDERDLSRVLYYLKFLVKSKSLIEGGILNLIPTEALAIAPVKSFTTNREILQKLAKELGTAEFVISTVLDRLLTYQANVLDLGVDIIFPNNFHERVFRGAITQLCSPSTTFHLLEKIPMPKLDHISFKDIIIIRQNSEEFDDWRNELTQIFHESREQEAEIEERPDQFAKYLSARLSNKRRAIIKGAKRQGYWDNAKNGVWILGMGMLGAGASQLIPDGGVVANLLGPFVGGASPLLTNYIGHKLGTPVRESTQRLYSIFDAS